MGFLDFLFAGSVINSVKKARLNSSQPTHRRAIDYDHGYEDGYYDSCYDHGYHDDYNNHNDHDCDGYDDYCDLECDW